ncbi:MAG TPA: hypothetical protein VFG72_09755 [Marmoricola sp.]|nr:hypothetical protein [Marmoricola sp.]
MSAMSSRLSALAVVTALTLAACSGGDDGNADDAVETPSGSPSPSTSAVATDDEVTAPGTQLAFGDTATVAPEVKGKGTLLDLSVESAVQGELSDFAGFDLDDPYKKRGNYYYVRVTVKNTGEKRFGDVPVPLWGISGEDTLLRAVAFKSAFKKCPTEPLPKGFKPGDTFKTCLVYLSPDKGTLAGVSYRPTEEFVPIEWHGKVKMLPEKKKKNEKRTKKGKQDKGNG